jgi:hypothetical protein
MALFLAFEQGILFRDQSEFTRLEDQLARPKVPRSEHAEAVDRRRPDYYVSEAAFHFLLNTY